MSRWLGCLALVATIAEAQPRISAPGRYAGYSVAKYDGWQREARYLTMRDGVRLAIDIMRPTEQGVLHRDRLPVVWAHHRYHRASIIDGQLRTTFDWAKPLLAHGYVIAVVDARGSGASFGTQPGFYSPDETRDMYQVTEWLGTAPWSNGNVGMYGRSYLGHAQYFAAAQRPPHLKAIFPEMAVFEFYPMLFPGGVFQEYALPTWRTLTSNLDKSVAFDWFGARFGPVAPVDGDSGLALRAAAIEAHRTNWDVGDMWRRVPYRDSRDPETGAVFHRERSPGAYLADINRSGVAIYHLTGWLDPAPRDALIWYANLRTPQKLIVGPWFHTQTTGFDNLAEHLRWYDYWLKGIDNGIMREPPIHYGTFNAHPDSTWRAAWRWPLPNERRVRFYFGPGPTGTVPSRNDGGLSVPRLPAGVDSQRVDLTATSGNATRWTNGYGGPAGYPDLQTNDAKGWTYTTEPLARRLEVTGHPIVRFWVTADTADVDFFVYLEEVTPSGESRFVTDGILRASHAKLGRPTHRNLGLPYRPSRQADVVALSDQPRELVLDLMPTSYLFRAGHRIRVTITGADRDGFPPASRAAMVAIHRSARHPSLLDLPTIP
jgi:putative CocE/NonD family hydrolase